VKRPKRSPKPRFHVASKEALDKLEAELAEFNGWRASADFVSVANSRRVKWIQVSVVSA
jgi:hypothetical protein